MLLWHVTSWQNHCFGLWTVVCLKHRSIAYVTMQPCDIIISCDIHVSHYHIYRSNLYTELQSHDWGCLFVRNGILPHSPNPLPDWQQTGLCLFLPLDRNKNSIMRSEFVFVCGSAVAAYNTTFYTIDSRLLESTVSGLAGFFIAPRIPWVLSVLKVTHRQLDKTMLFPQVNDLKLSHLFHCP